MKKNKAALFVFFAAILLLGFGLLLFKQPVSEKGKIEHIADVSRSAPEKSAEPPEKDATSSSTTSLSTSKPVQKNSPHRLEKNEIPTGELSYVHLQDLVDKGDAQAQYDLYRLIKDCYSVEKQLSSLTGESDFIHDSPDGAESELRNLEEKKKHCMELGKIEPNTIYKLLDMSAAAGYVNAQIGYLYDGSPILENPAMAISNPELADEYKRKAIKYLTAATNTCNADAALNLATVYYDGIIVQKDLSLAFAYLYVANKMNLIKSVGSLYQKWSGEIDQDVVSSGVKTGERIYSSICS